MRDEDVRIIFYKEIILTRDQLLERITFINDEINQLKTNYAKLEGHLDETKHWLSQLEIKEQSDNEMNAD